MLFKLLREEEQQVHLLREEQLEEARGSGVRAGTGSLATSLIASLAALIVPALVLA